MMVANATLEQLKADRAAGIERMRELVELGVESGFTEEQRDELKKLQVADKDFEERISAAESLSSIEDAVSRSSGRRLQADALELDADARIVVKRDEKLDRQKGFRTPREFLSAVLSSYKAGEIKDERLNECRSLAAGSDEQSTFSDPFGGFLLPEGFSPNMLTVPSEADPTAGRVTDMPMSTPSVSLPARTDKDHSTSVSGGLTVSRRDESGAAATSRMQMEKVKLEANGLFGVAHATEELLARSPISFAALLEAGFRSEFRSEILNEKLNGTGSGEYEGVLKSPALVTQAKETSQTAATINATNIAKMRSRCWGYQNAIWLANHDTIPTLAAMNDGTNNIWLPSAREDVPDLLYGRPIYFTEYLETVGAKGDILLGNWSEYLEGTLEGIQSAESIHVRFLNHEKTFKFWTYNDGRCWWRSPLTPKKGANTLSPFVTLAARA